jgi:hypothetical protein
MTTFIPGERAAQAAVFGRSLPPDVAGYEGSAYRLFPEHRALNLAPSLREGAIAYFKARGISWHRHANHALSSQVACLNFLMPLATRPELLARVIGHVLGTAPPIMLELEKGADDEPWYVGFEWIGRADYLNEAGRSGTRSRGANATSADAVVRFEQDGRIETVLIEWKYTERYGAPVPPRGHEVRLGRYRDLVFAPKGPILADQGLTIADFFWEPFYQLLRQQMLAYQMQSKTEDGSERVRVLHISPRGNRALHAVTAPALRRFGSDAFEVFRSLLVCPDDFICRSVEDTFGAILSEVGADPWADYLLDRYSFMRPA